MRPLLSIAFFIACSFPGSAQSTGYGKPIIWYTVYDPWAMFMGAEGPIFTVYENGQVIYWRDHHYSTVQLDKTDLAELMADLSLSDTFFTRSRHVAASGSTDQPTYVLSRNFDTLKTFSIYGSVRDPKAIARIPAVLKTTYDYITSYDNDRALNWLPDKIEILLSGYDNSPEKPIPWPAGWPDLSSQDTRPWGNGGASMYLDQRHFQQLKDLLKKRREKQAFLISDHKFFVSYRLPLPGIDSVMASAH